jgi:RNA polymerase sigma-70 factor (ECF subfamily)
MGEFATTHWSLVLGAGRRGSPDADEALATLCERYCYPLYAYVRRRVLDVHEAQDLTKEFFARLLEKDGLARASPDRGRFRSFLLTAMKNFLANERDRANAKKRGAGRVRFSLDLETGEFRFRREPVHNLTPERAYERQWVLTLLDRIMEALRGEFVAAGKAQQFELYKEALAGDRGVFSYPALALGLGISEGAARQAVHRLRRRYRKMLREEVAETLADRNDVDEEIHNLFVMLGP